MKILLVVFTTGCCVLALSRCCFATPVPRPNARARERVWLHKSKSLGSLQNLKASNEITKQQIIVVAKEIYYYSCTSVWVERLYDAVGYNSLVCAVHFQDLLQQLEFLIYTYCTNSHRQAIDFWKQIHSRRRTSKHWRACRSSFVLCFYFKSV